MWQTMYDLHRLRMRELEAEARATGVVLDPGRQVMDELLAGHPKDNILIIGQYLEQLRIIGERLDAPVLTGQTPEREREVLLDARHDDVLQFAATWTPASGTTTRWPSSLASERMAAASASFWVTNWARRLSLPGATV